MQCIKNSNIFAMKSCEVYIWKKKNGEMSGIFVTKHDYSNGGECRKAKGERTWSCQWGFSCTDWWKTNRSLVSLQPSWHPADRWKWGNIWRGLSERGSQFFCGPFTLLYVLQPVTLRIQGWERSHVTRFYIKKNNNNNTKVFFFLNYI